MSVTCGTISKVKHYKGNENEVYTSILVLNNGKRLHITYNCLNNSLLIHEWYILPKDEIEKITTELTEYFASL